MSYSDTRFIQAWQETSNIRVYPNPVQTQLSIHFPFDLAGEIQLSIFNLQGQVVQQGNYQLSEASLVISMHTLPRGTYFLRISSSQGIFTHKIEKQ